MLYRASRIIINIRNLHFSMDLFTAIHLARSVAKLLTFAAKKRSNWWMGIMINGGRECLVTLMNWDELFCSHKKMRRFVHLKIKQFDYMLSWLLV